MIALVRKQLSGTTLTVLTALTILVLAAAGCDNVERAGPQPTPSRADTGIELDVPQIMRGTVASETIIRGYPQAGDPGSGQVIVRGYGLVVGLAGTGSRDIPPDLRAHMLREMTRRGLGSERTGWGQLSPETVLDSLDTSVVVVEAIVPPGAKEGTRFDVRVYADPRTGTTSLEGGRLYTTDLRPGALQVGGGQTFALAAASGAIFVNPFAEPNATSFDTVDRNSGRILNGGVVLKDMPLKLQLITPSHARAAQIQNAINTRFPKERGQRDPTARGESDELIALTVPPSYRDSTDEFVALVQHVTVRQVNPEAVAMTVRRSLLADPAAAPTASLRWQALGNRSLPVIRDLYDSADELPRLAALSAGAKLNDGLVVPHLIEMTESGSYDACQQAIELLAGMPINPQIDAALRNLLDDEDVDVRLAAYEAMIKRGDPYLGRYNVEGKFVLDVVDSDWPMIYITQAGQPRIVIFGQDLHIIEPLVMQAWSNRLMIKSEPGEEQIEVYYRGEEDMQGAIHRVSPALPLFIDFLANRTTVEDQSPGLDLSYGQTVGALHQIWRQGFINADFKAEQDRILAAILRQERESDVPERPEFATTPTEDLSADEHIPQQ